MLLKQLFFKEVQVIEKRKSNFTKAVNSVWKAATSEYIFHLEDDWILYKPINLSYIMTMFKPKTIQIRLRWKGGEWLSKFGLSPGIIKKCFYKRFAGNFNFSLNPERQIRDKVGISNVLIYPEYPVVKDIGRKWMEQN